METEVKTMTPEQQRIAIAEACGWYDFGTTAPERGSLEFRIIGRNQERMDRRIIPDYLNDLNAMHEAEKCIPADRLTKYKLHLQYVTSGAWNSAGQAYEQHNAEAWHKAEAFLRTIGKWKEEA